MLIIEDFFLSEKQCTGTDSDCQAEILDTTKYKSDDLISVKVVIEVKML